VLSTALEWIGAMPDRPQHPGEGFWGWLGRQFGHVKKAVKTDVEQEAEKQAQGDPETQVVYQNQSVQEAAHPENPDLKLRRTVIDEVIVDKKQIDKESC
jgi:hypothetical protein